MFKSIKIDNFKALNDFSAKISPFTVFIGNNAAGKTTVLQAISFLKYCCASHIEKFMDERGLTVSDLASKFSTKRTMSFTTTLELDAQEITWTISFALDKARNQILLNSEKVVTEQGVVLQYDGNRMFRINEATGNQDPIMEGNYDHSIIKLIDCKKDAARYRTLVKIQQFFENVEDLALLSPAAMRKSSQGEASLIGLNGEKLSSFIKCLAPEKKQKLVKEVQSFMKPFVSLEAKTKQYGWAHLETKEAYDGKQIDVSASNISDGTLRIIAFCALLYSKSHGGAILLDEIEDGINNEHLETLVKLLRKVNQEKGIQVIATTHNTVLLDYWCDAQENADSITYIGRREDGHVTACSLLGNPQIQERLKYMYPGEVVLNMSNAELESLLGGRDAV